MKVISHTTDTITDPAHRPSDSAHASTLLHLHDGAVLCAWFGGSWEKNPDVAIWMARRRPEGTWTEPWIAAETVGIAQWNPVLFRYPDDTIVLFYKVGATIPEWKTFRLCSDDEGLSWSEPEELVAGDESGGRGPVKNKPIVLSDGKTVLAPASREGECWDAFVDISTDCGRTWEKSRSVPIRRASYNIQMVDQMYESHRLWGKGMIQPSLWQDGEGVVHLFCRTTSSAIFRSDSTDGGRTWNLAYDTGLPNNNSGLDLVKTPDGTIYLVYNPVGNLPNYYKGPRTPLVVDCSVDNGRTFSRLAVLADGPGDFAYPSIICDGNTHLMVTYTHKREYIRFVSLVIEKEV